MTPIENIQQQNSLFYKNDKIEIKKLYKFIIQSFGKSG